MKTPMTHLAAHRLAVLTLLPACCALCFIAPAQAQDSALATTQEFDAMLELLLGQKDDAMAIAIARRLDAIQAFVPTAYQLDALTRARARGVSPMVAVLLERELLGLQRERGDWSAGPLGMQGALGEHGCLTDFTMVGPFANDSMEGFFAPLAPETGESGPYPGKIDEVDWRPLPGFANLCVLNIDVAVRPYDQSVVYLASSITMDAKASANLLLGANGSYKVWLNGKLVGQRDEDAGLWLDNDAWSLPLSKGENHLLIKLASDQATGLDLIARVVDRDLKPLRAARIAPVWSGTPVEAGAVPVMGSQGSIARARALALGGITPGAVWGAWLWRKLELRNAATPWRDVADKLDASISSKALSLSPREHILLAELFEEHWRRVEVLERARALYPEDPWVAYTLAREYDEGLTEKRKLQRRVLLEDVLARNPGFTPAVVELAQWWQDQGFSQRALALIKAHATPEHLAAPGLRRAYISALEGVDMEREARQQRELLEADAQVTSNAAWRQVRDAVALGELERALALTRTQRARNPWSRSWTLKEVDLLRAQDKLDEAITLVSAHLEQAPGDVDVWQKKADLLIAKNDRDGAVLALERALASRPQDQDLRDLLSHLLPDADRFHDGWMREDLRELSATTDAGPFHSSTLVDQTIVRVAPNGLAQRVKQVAVRVNSAQGVEDADSIRVSFTQGDERVDVLRVRVLKADGTINEDYDTWGSQDTRKASTTYNDNISMSIRANNVEVGDIVEFRYRVSQIANRNFRGDYFGDIEYVQGVQPIAFGRYAVLYPKKWGQLYFRAPGVPHKRADNATPDARALPAGYNVTSFDMLNVPYVKTDPGQPGYTDVYDYILVSNKKTYNEVGQWWWNLVKEQLIVDENIRETVKKLTRGLTTQEQKVQAIHNYVVQNTRYLHVGLGIHGWKPYRTTTCFRNRYGDCKDKAALLKVMLEEAGVKANLVLVRTRTLGAVDELPASMHIFNHAIAYVPELDLFLDGTAEFNGTRELTSMDQGAQALIVQDGGTTRWVTLPVDAPGVNRITRKMSVDLTGDEPLTTIEIVAHGANAVYMRSSLEDPERRDEVLEKQLASDFPGAELIKATYSDLSKLEQPVSIKVTFRGGQLLRESDGRKFLYPLGERKDLLSAYASQAVRNQDLSIRVPFASETVVTYKVPASAQVGKTPRAKSLKSKFGEVTVEYTTTTKGVVVANVRYSIDVQRISAQDYPEFREFMSEATATLNETIELD